MTDNTPDQYQKFVQSSAVILNAMSNTARLRILSLLSEREISVLPLSELLGLSQSALSQHLAKLREAKLVTFRKEAQTVYYRCESPAVSKILAVLSAFFDPPEEALSEVARERAHAAAHTQNVFALRSRDN